MLPLARASGEDRAVGHDRGHRRVGPQPLDLVGLGGRRDRADRRELLDLGGAVRLEVVDDRLLVAGDGLFALLRL
ncbi:hypothetical protein GCM10029964_039190 [Kibdelosporangium lantanae]